MVRLPDSTGIPSVGLRGQRPQARIDSAPIARGEEEIGRSFTQGNLAIARAVGQGGEQIGQAEQQGGAAEGQAIVRGGQVMADAEQRGGAAIAGGLQTFGKGIENFGAGLAEFKLANDRLNYDRGQSDFQVGKTQLDQKYANDTEYSTLQDRYTKDLNELQQKTSQGITNDAMRERFMLGTAPTVAKGIADASHRSFVGIRNVNTAGDMQRLDDLSDALMQTKDPEERQAKIETANGIIEGMVKTGAIDPVKAQSYKSKWTENAAKGWVASHTDEEQINLLRDAPKSREDVVNRITSDAVEGTGKNPNSSATGTGQFIDSTWLSTLKAHRPDIARGRTDAQLLSLRNDSGLGKEMTGYLVDDNTKALKAGGVVPTPTSIYLAHFLGAQGAIDVMRAKPGTPVDEVLEENQITANRKVLDGKTTDGVIAWANQKMGGATRGRGDPIDFISEDGRVNLLNSATARYLTQQRAQDSETAIAQDQVKQQVAGDVHKMLTFGQGDDKLTPDLVRSVYGSKGVIDWQNQRNDAHAIWVNSHDLSTMMDTAITQRLASIAPKQGDQDFARKEVIAKAVADQAAALQKTRATDPAASVSDDPVVKQAAAALNDSPERTQALATARIVAQTRAGVASPAPATMQEMTAIAARLSAPVPAGTDPGKAMAEEAAKWGGYWPTIYGKLYSNGDDTGTKSYGPGFFEAYRRVHAPDGDPSRITDPTSLYSRVGPKGDLTVAGVDKLLSEIKGRGTPEGVAESEMKSQFLKTAKSQISGSDEGLHIKDPKGDELYLKFLAQALPAYDAGRAAGKSSTQLLNPDSPDYVGKLIGGFKRPMDQWFGDTIHDSPVHGGKTAAPAFDIKAVKSVGDLVTAYRAGQVTKAAADQFAIDNGWAAKRTDPAPQVPVSAQVPANNLSAADNALKLTPQEKSLYQRHVTNLNGAGGVDNADGSRSSLYQAVQEHDGKFYNIPTVWNGKIETEKYTDKNGKVWDVPNKTALANVTKEGWNKFPSYKTAEEADARYEAMHKFMETDTADYLRRKRGGR